MTITDIHVRKLYDNEKMKAIVSVTFDDMLVIHDIKVIQGAEKTFIAMPSKKNADLIVPEGGKNLIALEMIVGRIQRHIEQH